MHLVALVSFLTFIFSFMISLQTYLLYLFIRLTFKKCWFSITQLTLIKTCRPKKFYCYATKNSFFVPKKSNNNRNSHLYCSFVSCVIILFKLTKVINNTDCNPNIKKHS